ncbi:sugar ABC transporter substrate-binding protein [Streptomyces tremellae]|uniref:Sugar ABC transporter substrate-binding protein n=1 Tax=Streptomyces tremellae TaxID=1124239 RepID=A0ABP7GBG7_9ACTN
MRKTRAAAAVTAVSVIGSLLAACGGGSSSDGGGSNESPKTLTYWASNQGPNVDYDKKTLGPELAKFQKQTGIKVKLEVVPWSDLLNRILAATTSGQGPDVLNIGNTWSASLQASGALLPWNKANFDAIGGRDRFNASAVAAAGSPDKDPAAVPLYSLAYALYYNKKMFKDAGITTPPTTWAEVVKDGQKISKNGTSGKWGLGLEGSNLQENIHISYVLAKQHNADFFDTSGKPTFTSPGAVDAVMQYVDMMQKDKIINPGNAEYAQNQSLQDFGKGKTAMVMWQAAASNFASQHLSADDWGAVPMPVRSGTPGTGSQVNSMVAGINMAIFNNTKNVDGAKKFVKFMTSDAEQVILNKAYGSVPPVKAADGDAAFQQSDIQVMAKTLQTSATPLPQVPSESQYETQVGTALKNLWADVAAGKTVTKDTVKSELSKAQQQMTQ